MKLHIGYGEQIQRSYSVVVGIHAGRFFIHERFDYEVEMLDADAVIMNARNTGLLRDPAGRLPPRVKPTRYSLCTTERYL